MRDVFNDFNEFYFTFIDFIEILVYYSENKLFLTFFTDDGITF